MAFQCCRCGQSFESLPPPAETRPDDPDPTCLDCIEEMVDEIEPEPLTDEEIRRILRFVVTDK